MKVVLDLSKLLEDGQITQAEADRLKSLSAQQTGSAGINILLGFGVTAVAVGAVALVPTPLTAIAIGAIVFAGALVATLKGSKQWAMLGQISLVVGALMFCGGVAVFGEGSLASMLIVTAALAACAIVSRSSLLIALAVLAVSSCLGARTGYRHAMYSLAIFEPALTIALFSAIALGAYQASKRLAADYERLAISAARTSVLLVNMGFWIGSLWGDPLVLLRSLNRTDPSQLINSKIIPDWAFSLGWAAALIAIGAWGVTANRRWVVNVAAIFGAIHFYTQWFERLGANAITVLLGGLLMIGFAYGLWAFNKAQVSEKS